MNSKRNDFCDFDKPRTCAYQKEKIKSNKKSKHGGQSKSACEKGRGARVKSFQEINSSEDCP